jgi:hypothetical protein
MDLATAPEYRSRGFATTLLAAGEQAARERGLLVAVTRTLAPELFHRQGWSICGRHLFSTAAPRSVLAELGATAAGAIRREPESAAACLLQPRPEPIAVRPLRRIELSAVVRLYQAESARRSGWPLRSEEYFEWLLARGACDRVYIAAIGPETSDIEKLRNSVVGYAFVRQGRIVELIAADGNDDVARHLAARVCADASEHGGWEVRCDAPGDHPLHELLRRAGGKLTCDQQLAGEYFMARLLDPLAVLRQMADLFAVRLSGIEMTRGAELGIELRSQTGGRNGVSSSPSSNGPPHGTSSRHESMGPGRGVVERFRLLATNRGVEVETGGPARHTIVLRYSDLAPLVLGDGSADDWIASGRMRANSRTARQLAAALFPVAAWWRPPLDDLLA